MSARPRTTRFRRLLLAVTVALTSAPFLVAAPAQALPSGAGWGASWDYYTGTSYQYSATLPGVKLTGYGTDSGGDRTTLGTIQDTADDGMCARALIYADGVGYLADVKACGNGVTKTYAYQQHFDGKLLVVIQHSYPQSTSYEESLHLWIPSSKNDPTLRSVGTGMRWKYLTGSTYEYAIKRPGVELDGDGQHLPGDLRSALSSLDPTGAMTCAKVHVSTWNNWLDGDACLNEIDTVMGWSWEGWIDIEVCSRPMLGQVGQPVIWRCIDMLIPAPY
ncbi:hypothetical protein Cme02nite_32230 [Catellatospora methionotrophica]|uniref:Uncharacterized protein n=1 Tax=Catellatospora methionotrophica TaxID=121620 RepID=A0A8J3PH13_9ACTN|nr:hypothetical protein [Catellatospora methionotrophica]GIG14891.1 hypothetical protein Cme02nite_32230 [Catellatospora methionotrophica]